jgi:hypothetical protein
MDSTRLPRLTPQPREPIYRPRQAGKEGITNNQGIYSVSVDSADPEYFSGFATGDGQFQAVLFATNGLASGDHTLKIANENSRNIEQYPKYIYLDIDYFALTGELFVPVYLEHCVSSTD